MRRWLLFILQEEAADHADVSSSPSGNPAESIAAEQIPRSLSEGPPEHWVNLVRDRAPELLHAMARRQAPTPRHPLSPVMPSSPREPPPQGRRRPSPISHTHNPPIEGSSEHGIGASPVSSLKGPSGERTKVPGAQRELPRIPAIAESESKQSDDHLTPNGQEMSPSIATALSGIARELARLGRHDRTHETPVVAEPERSSSVTLELQPVTVRETARPRTSSPSGPPQMHSEPQPPAAVTESLWPELGEGPSSRPSGTSEYEAGARTTPAALVAAFPAEIPDAERPVMATSTRTREATPIASSWDTHFGDREREDPWPELPDDSEPSEPPWDVQQAEAQHLRHIDLEQRGRGRWSE